MSANPELCGLCGQTRAQFNQPIVAYMGGYAHEGCADQHAYDLAEDWLDRNVRGSA